MHFSPHLRLRRRGGKGSSEPEMHISAPVSQPFDYGAGGIPPWLNDYAAVTTVPVSTPHAARKNYHTKHEFIPERRERHFGSSSSCSSSSSSFKLETPAHDPSLPPPLLQVPAGLAAEKTFWESSVVDEDVEVDAGIKGNTKKRRFGMFRNKGLDERGRLADEWEEIYSDDWGCPDEYSRKKKWYE